MIITRNNGRRVTRGEPMKFAVIQFPGSNCDQDCLAALRGLEGAEASYVWHKERSLEGFDAIVLPGGFSYGDYLRCGAIARFSPIMQAVVEKARAGMLVIGICNGFQILCEAGLLPGALVRNRSLHFICEMVTLRVETGRTAFTRGLPEGALLRMPLAHGEGCYFADKETLRDLNANRQVVLRYADANGNVVPAGQPERIDRKHRRDLQSRGQHLRIDAAPGSRLRRAPGERGWRGHFSLDDGSVRGRRGARGLVRSGP